MVSGPRQGRGPAGRATTRGESTSFARTDTGVFQNQSFLTGGARRRPALTPQARPCAPDGCVRMGCRARRGAEARSRLAAAKQRRPKAKGRASNTRAADPEAKSVPYPGGRRGRRERPLAAADHGSRGPFTGDRDKDSVIWQPGKTGGAAAAIPPDGLAASCAKGTHAEGMKRRGPIPSGDGPENGRKKRRPAKACAPNTMEPLPAREEFHCAKTIIRHRHGFCNM